MARFQSKMTFIEEDYNPFVVVDNSEALKFNLDEIDSRNIRSRFKATEDPIKYVFDCFDSTSLKTLARDFVKESFSDMVSFISNIVNN